MIDLRTGIIANTWDLTELKEKQEKHIKESGQDKNYDYLNAVLNGIAYFPKNDSFLITGKMWDFIFEVKLDYYQYMH